MPIDLNRVRHLFNQPKKHNADDFIQREIAGRMLERLQLIKLDPKRVLDAGCGRGDDLKALQTHFSAAHIIGLDAAQQLLQRALMIKKSRGLLSSWLSRKNKVANDQLINGDFGRLPLPDLSIDLIWSNLALHWHFDPDQVLKEWRRVLRANGLLMFSCFGPDSLKELRHAFEGVDETPHTLRFVDMHDFGDMLINAGFATPVMDMEIITLTYATVEQLLAEVRSFGGNPLSTQRRGLMGKAAWNQMHAALGQSRTEDGRVPLTLEVIYGHAFKPIQNNRSEVSIIKFDKLKK